jgi:sugar lactone lactonase YvrE
MTNRVTSRCLLIALALILHAQSRTIAAGEFPNVIVLPGATSTEGIAAGDGTTFYASDLLTGDIFKGDLQSGVAARFIAAPAGRQAFGLKADVRHGLLFVAGGFTGQAYVYDLRTGVSLASFQLGGVINDVALTNDAAWFTDSVLPHLYRVPIAPGGSATTLVLTGPAATVSGFPNLNGIAATPDGKTLIVAHTQLGGLFIVDATTGASSAMAGVSLPAVDGILLSGGRLYAVQIAFNQIAQVAFSPDLSTGVVDAIVTSPDFEIPTTVAAFGDRLAAVNAKYDTGFPPTASSYEVITVRKP